MRRVVLESPYAGEVARNVAYARRAVRDCIERMEAPIASHLLFTQPGILRDEIEEERLRGIAAGHAWMTVAEAVVFYIDYGWSRGMQVGFYLAEQHGLPIEERRIGRNDGEAEP